MKFRLLALLLCAVAALNAPSLRATEATAVEKTWFFTTGDSLTIDLRLRAGFTPDWASSSLSLVRANADTSPTSASTAPVAATTAPQRLPISASQVHPLPDLGVVRIAFSSLAVTHWSPTNPALYQLTLELTDRTGHREIVKQRIGFRAFETKAGQLLLNGRPIFLRGLAINPPGRGVPDELERSRGFAEDYVRYLKSIHVNIIRIPDDPTWYDVCDELGMMVFGGNYGGHVMGGGPSADPADAARWFREEKFHPIAHHPSLLIYALTNETPGEGPTGDKWTAFLGEIHRRLQPWDPTRLYIANAGYGYGRVGEINDLHRYWGWYYESPYTFLHLRDYPRLVFPEKVQPLTFTECVGNYLGPDGRTNLTPNHKNPVAQQNWTGHAPTDEQGLLGFEHQSLTVRQATELFRRLRPQNSELSGVFPFTILFNQWHTITSFADMDPKPAALQLRASYSPVLVSWELYTPQVYAGTELHPIIHLVNDADDGADVRGATLHYELRDSTQRVVASGQLAAPDVAYYGTARLPLTVKLPADLATGTYTLTGQLTLAQRTLSENQINLFIAAPGYARTGTAPRTAVRLFDPTGKTRAAFERAGLAATPLTFGASTAIDSTAPIVIAEDAAAALTADQARSLGEFVRRGGRLLLLRQSHTDAAAVATLLPAEVRLPASDIDDPAYPPPPRPSRNGFNVNPERPEHPVFAGIERRRLQVWSDFTGWDEQKKGFPQIYPVSDGFVLKGQDPVRDVAVLANYSPGLEGNALAEFFSGEGSVLFSAFALVARAGLDPVADRLLANLVSYTTQPTGHERYVLIDAPIEWGRYETEHGVLTGINSGLMLNSRPALTGSYRDLPITVTKEGHEFAGGPGGWNSRPGLVYVPFGRRPFGPYVHRGWSGVPEAENAATTEGRGHFWCRIPEGKTSAVHRVCNPSDEPLTAFVSANGREVSLRLAPGATASVTVPLAPDTSIIETTVRGDRRLVLLETHFE